MYSVVKIGASQYRVLEGDVIEVGRINEEDGKKINLDKVLLYAKGSDVRIGQPYLKDVTVAAEIKKHVLGEKTIAFKYRKRKDSATKVGHRRKLTTINITKITAK